MYTMYCNSVVGSNCLAFFNNNNTDLTLMFHHDSHSKLTSCVRTNLYCRIEPDGQGRVCECSSVSAKLKMKCMKGETPVLHIKSVKGIVALSF